MALSVVCGTHTVGHCTALHFWCKVQFRSQVTHSPSSSGAPQHGYFAVVSLGRTATSASFSLDLTYTDGVAAGNLRMTTSAGYLQLFGRLGDVPSRRYHTGVLPSMTAYSSASSSSTVEYELFDCNS